MGKADMAELANYIGKNLVHLIDRDEDDAYCFRLHKDRYVVVHQTIPTLIWLRAGGGGASRSCNL